MPASDAAPSAVAALTRSNGSWMIRPPPFMRRRPCTKFGERIPMFFRYVNRALDALLQPFMQHCIVVVSLIVYPLLPVLQRSLNNPRKPFDPVVAATGDQTHAVSVAHARHSVLAWPLALRLDSRRDSKIVLQRGG